MINNIMLYIGSVVIIVRGIAHIVPVKNVAKGLGSIPQDNKRIITMEWVAEGVAMCFMGLLVLFVTIVAGPHNRVSTIVYGVSAGMLIAVAVLTSLTGARTSIVPIRICPFIMTAVAVLFILGSALSVDDFGW